jgi:uncharacterized protein YdeI (BOF family)
MKISKKVWIPVVVVLALALVVGGVVYARHEVRPQIATQTVAQINQASANGEMVVLKGSVSQVNKDGSFTFKDSTGEIKVQSVAAYQFHINLTSGQQVTLYGRVDLGTQNNVKTTPELQLLGIDVNGQTYGVTGMHMRMGGFDNGYDNGFNFGPMMGGRGDRGQNFNGQPGGNRQGQPAQNGNPVQPTQPAQTAPTATP